MGIRQLQQRVRRLELKLAARLALERKEKALEFEQRQDERDGTVLRQMSTSELRCLHEAMTLEQEGKPLTPEHEAAIRRYAELHEELNKEEAPKPQAGPVRRAER